MDREKYERIAEFGKHLMMECDLEDALETIAEEAKFLVNAQRCSIFIVDRDAGMLWTKISDGIGRIAIGTDSGIAGDTFTKQEPQIVNNPYEDERFLPKIDEKSGFTTHNILTVPIFDSRRDVIGVIQMLNKIDSEFSGEDVELLAFLANYVSGTLELALLSEK